MKEIFEFYKPGECYITVERSIFWDAESWNQYMKDPDNSDWGQVKNCSFAKGTIFMCIKIVETENQLFVIFLYDNKFWISSGRSIISIKLAKETFEQITGLTNDSSFVISRSGEIHGCNKIQ